MIAYVTIGNSDDKLTQREWACFQIDVSQILNDAGCLYHGEWNSHPTSIFQNACWCVEVDEDHTAALKDKLKGLSVKYGQDSIVWAQAPQPEFLSMRES
jgi:hypothetical protein